MTINSEQIQALKAKAVDRIIAEIKAKHSHYDAYAPVMTWGEFCTIVTERAADKALIAEQARRIEFLKEQLAQLANFNPDWDKLEAATDSLREHMAELTEANKRIAELQARALTVKFPEDWHFEECETEGCQNGALFSVGKAAKNLHLCEACAKEPANSRLSKTALPKRLPFRVAAGITLVVGE